MNIQHFHGCINLLILAFCLNQTLSDHPHSSSTDLNALLSFKSLLADPYGVIKNNWTANSSFCNWLGVTCNVHKRVTVLNLTDIILQGMISPHLGNLSFLDTLVLGNTSLVGQIPESIGELPRLTKLGLQSNFLSGHVPLSIFNMSSLARFSVDTNNLSGTIPPYLNRTLPQLVLISLSLNQFSGDDVLLNFARCRNLEVLSLSDNYFRGSIPNEIGSMSKLTELYLGANEFSGTIPLSLGNLTNAYKIDMDSCNLVGTIPIELGNLMNLEGLRLDGNSLDGPIPVTLMNNSKLFFLDLSRNKLTGHVPVELGTSLPLLQVFNVGQNQLSGGFRFLSSLSNCKNLIVLALNENNLEGMITENIANLSSSLLSIHAEGNHINGNIPSGLGNLSSLLHLDLTDNKLTGKLPTSFSGLQGLGYMSLSYNNLMDSIPTELGAIKNLNTLLLGYNHFSGSLPESLSNISLLQHLDLQNNKLSSSIPKRLWTLVNLLSLDLSKNSITGSLSHEVGNMKALFNLNLSVNNMSGNIPSALGELLMLSSLDLSKNSFSFEIPESFGRLLNLKYLNLSYNFLSMSIPKSLANLSDLNIIDLSHNELEGQVPLGKVFTNSTISYLSGNKALCGAPQLKPCSTNITNFNMKKKSRSIILGTILGMVLLIILCVCSYFSYRKSKTLPKSHEPLLKDTGIISHHELVRATNNFSEANLLGKGCFGSVFKGCLDNGLIVAVKVLYLDIEDVPNSFEKECEILRMVRHRNLIKTISVCSNMEFKAIILEFMPNGNLEQCLYSVDSYINMNQRLNIMVDVASALEYLHHQHPNVILHCDLKPTNVLLDKDFIAHVGDFGISKLMYDKSIITTSMPGTIGYIAPEYSSNGMVSKMSDVYSFGILLLETFTKRKPTDDVFGEESSLRDWVFKAYPHAVLDIVDCKLLENHVSNLHHCLLSLIELGLLCTRDSPKERIPMTDVSKRLEKIKKEYLTER